MVEAAAYLETQPVAQCYTATLRRDRYPMRLLTRWFLNGHRISLSTNLLLLSVWCLGCGGPAPLTVERYRSRGVVLGVHGPIIGSGEPRRCPIRSWNLAGTKKKVAAPRDPDRVLGSG